MKPVICFGEALIDFLLFNVEQQGPLKLPEFRQYPGGAPANAAVAVAQMSGKALFAGQVGTDPFGNFLADALKEYKVDTRFLYQTEQAKTALAFVLLDEDGDRSFSFHRDGTADVIFQKEQVDPDWFQEPSILHFCSNTLTTESIADCTQHVVEQAISQRAIISFDVNLRHNLWTSGKADIQRVNSLVDQADVVKFSLDEFEYLSQGNDEGYLSDCLSKRCQLLLITSGSGSVQYHGRKLSGTINPPKINAVDTTAGGDAFIGGTLLLLSCLEQLKLVFESKDELESILHFAAACGACAVTKKGAFPALPNQKDVAEMLNSESCDLDFVWSLLRANQLHT